MGKRMIYIAAWGIGFVLGLLTSHGHVASAEELHLVQGTGNRVMTVEQLLQSYEWCSDDCAKVRSDLYLAELEEEVSEKNAGGEQSGKGFYTDYGRNIQESRTDKLKYEMLSETLLLSLLEKQQEYYECQKEWILLKQRVSKLRVRFGIADAAETEALLREQMEVEGLIAEAKRTAERIVTELKKETQLGEESLVLSYETAGKAYCESEVVFHFRYNSESYLQFGYYAGMYREYENELPFGEESLKLQTEALASNYELQERMLGEQLQLYAKDKLAEYEELQGKLEVAKGTLGACEKAYTAECKKLYYGRATKLSVVECKMELLSAELKCLQYLVDKTKLEYALDHGVVTEN